MTVPTLRSRRLVLRPLRAGDAEALYPTLADPMSMRWWSRPPVGSVEEARTYLADGDRDGWQCWYLADDEPGPAIGWVSIGVRSRPGVGEVGYLLARDRIGQGLAAEAVATILDHVFDVDGLRRVFADTDPDNAASCALLGDLGFALEGRLRAEWETHIGVRDSLIWGLLASDRRPWHPDA